MPTLEITTMVGCPIMCTYCPQEQIRSAYSKDPDKYMSYANFEKILSTVPKYVRIDFSGMSEPWVNPHCTDFLRHTLVNGYQVAIYTTLCYMDDFCTVINLISEHHDQIEALVIHLPDANNNMRGYTESQTYNGALKAFILYDQDRKLRKFELMTMQAAGLSHPSLAEYAPQLQNWVGNSRADSLNLSEIGTQQVRRSDHSGRIVSCSYTPFYDQNVVLPNGDVVLCCMDYGLKHRIGNLLTGDYFSLFCSEEMNRLRLGNMTCGGDSICKRCTRALYHYLGEEKQFWISVNDNAEV